ncbi:hypothetical protein D3C76_1502020 [compost metagenome]
MDSPIRAGSWQFSSAFRVRSWRLFSSRADQRAGCRTFRRDPCRPDECRRPGKQYKVQIHAAADYPVPACRSGSARSDRWTTSSGVSARRR